MDSFAGNILAYLITASPQILIGAIGIVMARSRLMPFPKARLHATFGFTLLLLYGLLVVFFRMYMSSFIPRDQVAAMANALTTFNLLGFVLMAACLVFLLLSVFADRKPETAG